MPIMSRPTLSRLRSPPLRYFCCGVPARRWRSLIEAEFDELGVHALAAFLDGKVRAAHSDGVVEVFLDPKEGIERILLRDVGDVRAEILRVAVEREVVHQHVTVGGLELTREQAQQRALAAAAGPHDADHLAAARGDTDALERGVLLAAEAMADLAQLDQADDVALLLDDAVGEMAAEILPLPERDRVAVH